MNIKWEDCKIEFAHDGALRDVQVIDATADDWREVFDFISGGASNLSFTVDGKPAALPVDPVSATALRATASPVLLFQWGDIELATHFFAEDDLEFDFRPGEIRSQAQLNQLLSFISGIGRRLGKTVLVFHEGWEMSPFLKYDPEANEVTYLRG